MGINSSTSSSRLSTTIPPTKSALDASVPIFSQLAYSRSLFSSRFIFFFFFLTRPRVSLSICLSIRPSRSLFDSVSLHSHIDHLVRVSLWNVFLCRPFDIVLLSLSFSLTSVVLALVVPGDRRLFVRFRAASLPRRDVRPRRPRRHTVAQS